MKRTLNAIEIGKAIKRSNAWVVRYAKAGLLPGEQVPHPAVPGRTTWRFNLEEVQEAVTFNPDLWGLQGVRRVKETRPRTFTPPDDHHTLTRNALAIKINRPSHAIWEWAVDGVIPSLRVGNRRWYNLKDVLQALEEYEQQLRKDKSEPRPATPPDGHHTLLAVEVAAATGATPATVRQWVTDGIVPSVNDGACQWFNLDDVCDALLREGRMRRSQPVEHTVAYEEHTLAIDDAAAAVGLSVTLLKKITRSGLVPHAVDAQGSRRFHLGDLQEALRRNPHLRTPKGLHLREDPRHTPGPPVPPLLPPKELQQAPAPTAPDSYHTATAEYAAEYAQQQVLPPGERLPWMTSRTVRDWVRGRMVSGIHQAGLLWVNPTQVANLLRAVHTPTHPPTTADAAGSEPDLRRKGR